MAQSQKDVNDVVRFAVDQGCSFFDTAEAYNHGASETSLGLALEGIPRDRVIIGTAAQCAEQLGRFVEAGCTYFVMNPICDNEETERQFEQIAAEILPGLAAK